MVWRVGEIGADRLAAHGGTPVRETLLAYGRQEVLPGDIDAVCEVLRSDWLTTGPVVERFESAFAARVGARHAVSFSSGTAALHGAVFAAGLGDGDEAVTTPLTFCATANALLYQGATPRFADVDPEALLLDPERVRGALGARTRAIVAVDYAGHPAPLHELREIARDAGLVLIEDASHAPGALYHDAPVGSLADLTTFSFHPVKHVTTGEGGMVTTDSDEYAARLRRFRNHGIATSGRERQTGRWQYEMVDLGYNYRLTDVACALGLAQLERLPANLARRREIAARYASRLRDLPGLVLPAERDHARSAWHLYPVRLELERLATDRDELLAALRAEGIGANVHYRLVYQQPYYRERFGDLSGCAPVAEDAERRLVSLPMYHAMTDADVDDVERALRRVLGYFAR